MKIVIFSLPDLPKSTTSKKIAKFRFIFQCYKSVESFCENFDVLKYFIFLKMCPIFVGSLYNIGIGLTMTLLI